MKACVHIQRRPRMWIMPIKASRPYDVIRTSSYKNCKILCVFEFSIVMCRLCVFKTCVYKFYWVHNSPWECENKESKNWRSSAQWWNIENYWELPEFVLTVHLREVKGRLVWRGIGSYRIDEMIVLNSEVQIYEWSIVSPLDT